MPLRLLGHTAFALIFILIGGIFGPPAWKISLGAGAGMFLVGVILQIYDWWPRSRKLDSELVEEWLDFRTLIRTNRDKRRNDDER